MQELVLNRSCTVSGFLGSFSFCPRISKMRRLINASNNKSIKIKCSCKAVAVYIAEYRMCWVTLLRIVLDANKRMEICSLRIKVQILLNCTKESLKPQFSLSNRPNRTIFVVVKQLFTQKLLNKSLVIIDMKRYPQKIKRNC